MPRVMKFDAFWEQAFAPALAATRERGAAAFAFHARAETVLAFARALGWLIRAFHKTEKLIRRDSRAVTVGMRRALSISPHEATPKSFASPDDVGVVRHGDSVSPFGRIRPVADWGRVDFAFAGCQCH